MKFGKRYVNNYKVDPYWNLRSVPEAHLIPVDYTQYRFYRTVGNGCTVEITVAICVCFKGIVYWRATVKKMKRVFLRLSIAIIIIIAVRLLLAALAIGHTPTGLTRRREMLLILRYTDGHACTYYHHIVVHRTYHLKKNDNIYICRLLWSIFYF